jgi:hypothetical protein
MELTKDQMEEIATIAVEKILVRMPDVIGNLMQHHAMLNKANYKFYKDHEEFAEHKNLVAGVIEEVELANPAKKYEELLTLAVPKIQEKIRTMKGLDTKKVRKSVSLNVPNELKPNGVI